MHWGHSPGQKSKYLGVHRAIPTLLPSGLRARRARQLGCLVVNTKGEAGLERSSGFRRRSLRACQVLVMPVFPLGGCRRARGWGGGVVGVGDMALSYVVVRVAVRCLWRRLVWLVTLRIRAASQVGRAARSGGFAADGVIRGGGMPGRALLAHLRCRRLLLRQQRCATRRWVRKSLPAG